MYIPDAVKRYKKKRIRKWVCLLAGLQASFWSERFIAVRNSVLCFKIFTLVLESVQNI